MATYGCNAAPSGICFLASEKRSTIRVVRVTSARFPSSPFSHVVALYEKPYKCEKKKRVVLIVESCFLFLVACYATLHPAMSVRRSVRRSSFYFFMLCFFLRSFGFTAPA